MAVIQLNPLGLAVTDNGYISSITVVTAGIATVLTPDANGQITVGPVAATRLVGGGCNVPGAGSQAMRLVTG